MPNADQRTSPMLVFPRFGERRFRVDPRLCFVIMPIGDEALDNIYETAIKPEIERHGLRCLRADEVTGDGRIMEDIWRSLCEARLVVCDLSRRNPNVYYELGMCHVVGKRTILLTQDRDIPFDVSDWRCIIYTDEMGKAADFRRRLGGAIDRTLAEDTEAVDQEDADSTAQALSVQGLHWEAAAVYLAHASKAEADGEPAIETSLLEKAVDQLRTGGFAWEAAENLIRVANVHRTMGYTSDYIRSLTRAANVYETAQYPWEAGQLHFRIASFHREAGDRAAAARHLLLAKEQYASAGTAEETEKCERALAELPQT